MGKKQKKEKSATAIKAADSSKNNGGKKRKQEWNEKKKNIKNNQNNKRGNRVSDKNKNKNKIKGNNQDKKKGENSGNKSSQEKTIPIGEIWSKSKQKRMRRILAKQRYEEKQKQGLQDSNDSGVTSESQGNVQNKDTKPKKKNKKKSQVEADDKETKNTKKAKVEKDEAKNSTDASTRDNAEKGKPKISALQQAFLERLQGSRFRILNEELYTTPSTDSFQRFQENPKLFQEYHEGFRTQVKSWPSNPVNVILKWILNHVSKTAKESSSDEIVIADFGCGDAKLAEELLLRENIKNSIKIHSFDLCSGGNENITECDIANVPLSKKSVNIGIFCLALMGTNIADFIREAHRVLKDSPDGILKIAEVRSRFETKTSSSENNQNEGDEESSTFQTFLNNMSELGFTMQHIDRSNKMFFIMDFVKNKKSKKKPNKTLSFSLPPCIYKRR